MIQVRITTWRRCSLARGATQRNILTSPNNHPPVFRHRAKPAGKQKTRIPRTCGPCDTEKNRKWSRPPTGTWWAQPPGLAGYASGFHHSNLRPSWWFPCNTVVVMSLPAPALSPPRDGYYDFRGKHVSVPCFVLSATEVPHTDLHYHSGHPCSLQLVYFSHLISVPTNLEPCYHHQFSPSACNTGPVKTI